MSMPPRLDRWTIGHNIRTIDLYRPKGPRHTSCRSGPTSGAATISPTADGRTATLLETPVHYPGPCSSDMPTGTIDAKYSPLSRHRTPGRNDIGRLRPFRRTAQGGSPQHRARARRFRGPDELEARCRYSHEERLQRHARRKSAHL